MASPKAIATAGPALDTTATPGGRCGEKRMSRVLSQKGQAPLSTATCRWQEGHGRRSRMAQRYSRSKPRSIARNFFRVTTPYRHVGEASASLDLQLKSLYTRRKYVVAGI